MNKYTKDINYIHTHIYIHIYIDTNIPHTQIHVYYMINNRGLEVMSDAFPPLTDLDVSLCYNVTSKGLIYALHRFNKLRILHTYGCYRVDVKALKTVQPNVTIDNGLNN